MVLSSNSNCLGVSLYHRLSVQPLVESGKKRAGLVIIAHQSEKPHILIEA